MRHSIYRNLRNNAPTLTVKKEAQKVMVNLISCMCDNTGTWTFRKNGNDEFVIFTHGSAFSNFQTDFTKTEIEAEANLGNWNKVFRMINSGTSVIKSVESK